jgi:hypothetical protein
MVKMTMRWLVELHLEEVPGVFGCRFFVVVCYQEVSKVVLRNWCLALIMNSGGWIFSCIDVLSDADRLV